MRTAVRRTDGGTSVRRASDFVITTGAGIMEIDQREFSAAFIQVTELSWLRLTPSDIRTEVLAAPHRRPSRLPEGSQAVYAFIFGGHCLKVGKAGPKTQARFTTQHYGFHAPSTLAKSILKHSSRVAELAAVNLRQDIGRLNEATVGDWIERNTARLHIYLDTATGDLTLSLLEAFAQCRLQPIFEGKTA